MQKDTPLAERMRPQTLDDIFGQSRILGAQSMLRRSIDGGRIPAMIFWGPPGCGKTSLAQVIRKLSGKRFQQLSAVSAGVKDVKEVISASRKLRDFDGASTILFIDEIHRFNKSQQDALLQAVEEGVITFIGATTENPSFEVNNALLSRCQLILFSPLGPEDLKNLFYSALKEHPRGLQREDLKFDDAVVDLIVRQADGDARFLLNQLEWIAHNVPEGAHISEDTLEAIQYRKPLRYDGKYDEHYNVISVFHKSIRGSDPDAALYWLHRMLEGGEDPRYILRRMMRMATEDVGLADPQAVVVAAACKDNYEFLGPPEGWLALDQLAVYLACAPKSNALEMAYFKVREVVQQQGTLPVPRAFRNAENKTGRDLGYGTGYLYDHNSPHAYSGQDHLPQKLQGSRFYEPTAQGQEKEYRAHLQYLADLRKMRQESKDE
jgi:putative ATPase